MHCHLIQWGSMLLARKISDNLSDSAFLSTTRISIKFARLYFDDLIQVLPSADTSKNGNFIIIRQINRRKISCWFQIFILLWGHLEYLLRFWRFTPRHLDKDSPANSSHSPVIFQLFSSHFTAICNLFSCLKMSAAVQQVFSFFSMQKFYRDSPDNLQTFVYSFSFSCLKLPEYLQQFPDILIFQL